MMQHKRENLICFLPIVIFEALANESINLNQCTLLHEKVQSRQISRLLLSSQGKEGKLS